MNFADTGGQVKYCGWFSRNVRLSLKESFGRSWDGFFEEVAPLFRNSLCIGFDLLCISLSFTWSICCLQAMISLPESMCVSCGAVSVSCVDDWKVWDNEKFEYVISETNVQRSTFRVFSKLLFPINKTACSSEPSWKRVTNDVKVN